MLGWSVHVKRGDETVLYAYSQDLGLDRKIRDQAEEEADYPDFDSGYNGHERGYPNRYHIRNDRLPQAEIYTVTDKTQPGDKFYRVESKDLVLGPFPNIPGDTILWVELWDQS